MHVLGVWQFGDVVAGHSDVTAVGSDSVGHPLRVCHGDVFGSYIFRRRWEELSDGGLAA